MIDTRLVKLNIVDRKHLLTALKEVSKMDADFSGANGDEYLWEVAKEKGFKSNADYLIDRVRRIEDDEKVVEKFLQLWLSGDSYYKSYLWNCICNENNQIEILSVTLEY